MSEEILSINAPQGKVGINNLDVKLEGPKNPIARVSLKQDVDPSDVSLETVIFMLVGMAKAVDLNFTVTEWDYEAEYNKFFNVKNL